MYVLVNMTLEGYNSFSRSLSVRVLPAVTSVAEARVDNSEGLFNEEDALPMMGGVSDWGRGRGIPPF